MVKKENFKKYFKKAQQEKWAIGQFNISNIETLKAIISAAQKLKSPVIIGTSEGESKFLGLKQTVFLIKAFKEETNLPIILNLDHGKTFGYVKEAILAGYDTVHFDGSKLPLKENIFQTKKIVKYAKKFNVLVEGEVGEIGGDLTNPKEAQEFVKETGVDLLAVNVGTMHGISASGKDLINFERLKEIKNNVGKTCLVLHGGSGVLNKDIKEAIKLGIVKININTDLRIIYTKTLRNVLVKQPKEFIPYKYMPEVIEAVEKIVEEKIKLFKGER